MRMQDLTKLFVNTINGLSGVVNFPILDASIAKGTHSSGTSVIIGRLDDQTASGNYSLAVGRENVVSAGGCVAMGRANNISASFSFAAGYGNVVQKVQNSNAQCAAAIGDGNTVDGYTAFAEGYHNQALKQCTHAEGQSTIASGFQAHSEGFTTTASGYNSHAENDRTIASGADSHAEGLGTIANHQCQHVFGRRNIPDPSVEASTTYGNYVEIVGNGQSENELSNARTLDWDGNEVLAGKLTLGAGPTNNMDAATKQYVDDAKSWTQCSGSSTSSSQKITYPAEATELLIKAKSSNSSAPAYFCCVPVIAISDVSVIQVGGYYYGSSDYGLANVNHDATNRTIAFRNLRFAGTTSGTVTVYWR